MSILDPMTAGNARPMTSLTGSAMRTMHQAPMPPWGNNEELAEDYAADPRQFLLDRTELWRKQCTVFHNWVITATYFLPHKIGKPGATIILPDVTHDEALYQGKIGLVIAKGPLAFKDDEHVKFQGQDVEIGEWVQYDVMEGRQFTMDNIHCRRLKDTQIVMRVPDPRLVY
jgi:hypothetical protein